jgi:PAS domain S-box-containing protein
MAIEYDVEARAILPVAVPGEPGGAAVPAPSVPREKDRLSRLLEAAPVVAYVTDAKERILHVSGRGQAEWGHGGESVIGKSLHQIFSEETALALSANNRKVRQAKTAMQFEETVDHGGRLRQYLSVKAPLRAFGDRPDAVGVIAVDITAHKQADQKAAQHARQMSELIEATPKLFGSGSVRSVLRAVADAARRLVGGDRATASVVSNSDVGHLLQATSQSEADRSALAGEDPRQVSVDALVYHVPKPVRLTAEQVADRGAWSTSTNEERSDSAARGWLAVPLLCQASGNAGLIQIWHAPGREFSEEDEAAIVQLGRLADVAIRNAAAHEESQRGERRKDEFLALLGHELRNPLAPMRNATKLLGERNLRDENVLFAKNVIERQVDQMTRMVDDLLDMSRIVSGRFVFQKQPVRLIDIVNRAVEMCSPLFDAKRQSLSVSGPDQETWVDADSGRLAQVLANLLNNASKFTPEHGTVCLNFERRDNEGIITVTDTGKGIPADMLKQIFGLFVQVERPEAGGPGLGLGLWLARNLVELQGGRISARSDGAGSGSEFAVTLPLLATPPTSTPSEVHFVASARQSSAKGRQVLVVDDNKDSADSIALLLTGEGHDVRVAYTGAAAIEATANWSPDIVFLDIALPDMTGYAVVKKMRARETTKRSAMIAVTGWGRQRDRDKTRAAGFDEHLVKPVDPAAVIALIDARARLVDEPEA